MSERFRHRFNFSQCAETTMTRFMASLLEVGSKLMSGAALVLLLVALTTLSVQVVRANPPIDRANVTTALCSHENDPTCWEGCDVDPILGCITGSYEYTCSEPDPWCFPCQ